MVRGLKSSEMVRGLERGFREFLFVFSLGNTVRLAGAKSSHHLHCNCVVLSLFGKKKKTYQQDELAVDSKI